MGASCSASAHAHGAAVTASSVRPTKRVFSSPAFRKARSRPHVSQPPRRHASLGQSVVAMSSKASKVGRYPPTPSTDYHPLTLPPTSTTAADGVDGSGGGGDGDDEVGRLCAQWRAAAGKPGAAVMREVRAMLRPNGVSDDADGVRDGASVHAVGTDVDDDHDGWRLLLTHKNENLYNAFALEVAAMSPSSHGLATGLFALPRPLPPAALTRMVGLRAVVDPLCVGATAAELVQAARALPVCVPSIVDLIPLDGGADGDDDDDLHSPLPPTTTATTTHPTPVALHHECVVRNPSRVSSPELYSSLGEVVGGWGGGFAHGMYARFKNPTLPESAAGIRETLRFVVVETWGGYVLGLTTFAPQQLPPRCDWNRKPNNYSAGTRLEIAAAAVNALVGAPDGVIGGKGGCHPPLRKKNKIVIVDPCCGGGTILYAAWSRGTRDGPLRLTHATYE